MKKKKGLSKMAFSLMILLLAVIAGILFYLVANRVLQKVFFGGA